MEQMPIIRQGDGFIVVCYRGYDCKIYGYEGDKPYLADGPECRGRHEIVGYCQNPTVKELLDRIIKNAEKVWAETDAIMDEYHAETMWERRTRRY